MWEHPPPFIHNKIPWYPLHLRLCWPYIFYTPLPNYWSLFLQSFVFLLTVMLVVCIVLNMRVFFAALFSHKSCCYHTLTTIPPSSSNLQSNCFLFVRYFVGIFCLLTPNKHISSSSICTVLNMNTHLKSTERSTAAATFPTPPEDRTISSLLIQNILMTFIDNCFGSSFDEYKLHDEW